MLTLGRAHVALCSLVARVAGACSGELRNDGANGAAAAPGTGGSATGGGAGKSGKGGSSTGGSAASGTGGNSGSAGGSVDDLCAQNMGVLRVGRTRLRRLTRTQVNNTLRDLVGATGNPASAIAPDEQIGPFYSNAIAPVTDLIVQQHQEVAKGIADERRFAHERARSLRSRRRGRRARASSSPSSARKPTAARSSRRRSTPT